MIRLKARLKAASDRYPRRSASSLVDLRDYWRFTPRGLRTLLDSAGLVVDTVETWGNRRCVIGNFRRWSAYRRWHPLHNDPDLAVQVWAFARNPG